MLFLGFEKLEDLLRHGDYAGNRTVYVRHTCIRYRDELGQAPPKHRLVVALMVAPDTVGYWMTAQDDPLAADRTDRPSPEEMRRRNFDDMTAATVRAIEEWSARAVDRTPMRCVNAAFGMPRDFAPLHGTIDMIFPLEVDGSTRWETKGERDRRTDPHAGHGGG